MTIKQTIIIFFLFSIAMIGQTTTSVTKEIPHYKNGHISVYYQATHFHFPSLKIDSLENGFDSLALRLWYHWSFESNEVMLQISKSAGQWTGTLYKFLAYGPPEQRKDSVNKTIVVPKNGWTKFITDMNSKNIYSLPDPQDIKGFEDSWTDGWGCSVEVATTKNYRFYNYHLPEIFQKKYWQHKNMVDILNIVEREFGIKWNHD